MTVRFMKNLLLGHHRSFQDLLREQPMYSSRTIDLIGRAVEFLCQVSWRNQINRRCSELSFFHEN